MNPQAKVFHLEGSSCVISFLTYTVALLGFHSLVPAKVLLAVYMGQSHFHIQLQSFPKSLVAIQFAEAEKIKIITRLWSNKGKIAIKHNKNLFLAQAVLLEYCSLTLGKGSCSLALERFIKIEKTFSFQRC